MKRAILIVAVVIFFFLILGGILFKLFAPSKPAETKQQANYFPQPSTAIPDPDVSGTPIQVAQNCYKWYVQRYAIYQVALGLSRNDPNLARCFTGDLYSDVTSESDEDDSDPVLLSQNYDESWKDQVSTSAVSSSVRDSDVQVILGSGNAQHIVVAHLIEDNDEQWKISSVSEQ